MVEVVVRRLVGSHVFLDDQDEIMLTIPKKLDRQLGHSEVLVLEIERGEDGFRLRSV